MIEFTVTLDDILKEKGAVVLGLVEGGERIELILPIMPSKFGDRRMLLKGQQLKAVFTGDGKYQVYQNAQMSGQAKTVQYGTAHVRKENGSS